jgi:L-fucose isomerase-like protein
VTFGRVSTDDLSGKIRAYVGEGSFTDDPLQTFGTRAVVHVPKLQRLMRTICRDGFEHHAAMNGAYVASATAEGLGNYLGWQVYHHNGEELET